MRHCELLGDFRRRPWKVQQQRKVSFSLLFLFLLVEEEKWKKRRRPEVRVSVSACCHTGHVYNYFWTFGGDVLIARAL